MGNFFMLASSEKSESDFRFKAARIDSIEQFHVVQNDSVGICLLKRPVQASIRQWCEDVSAQCIHDFEGFFLAASPLLKAKVTDVLGGFPHHPAQAEMECELARSIQLFCDITASKRLRIRFGVVTTDECRKFHVDAAKIRLFCTYSGPGTELIRDEDLVFENLGKMDCCFEDCNKSILNSGALVQHMMPFEIGFAKGVHPLSIDRFDFESEINSLLSSRVLRVHSPANAFQ